MCSPTVFIRDSKGLEPVMGELTSIAWRDKQCLILKDITGRVLEIEGKILSMDLIAHEIVLGKVSESEDRNISDRM